MDVDDGMYDDVLDDDVLDGVLEVSFVVAFGVCIVQAPRYALAVKLIVDKRGYLWQDALQHRPVWVNLTSLTSFTRTHLRHIQYKQLLVKDHPLAHLQALQQRGFSAQTLLFTLVECGLVPAEAIEALEAELDRRVRAQSAEQRQETRRKILSAAIAQEARAQGLSPVDKQLGAPPANSAELFGLIGRGQCMSGAQGVMAARVAGAEDGEDLTGALLWPAYVALSIDPRTIQRQQSARTVFEEARASLVAHMRAADQTLGLVAPPLQQKRTQDEGLLGLGGPGSDLLPRTVEPVAPMRITAAAFETPPSARQALDDVGRLFGVQPGDTLSLAQPSSEGQALPLALCPPESEAEASASELVKAADASAE